MRDITVDTIASSSSRCFLVYLAQCRFANYVFSLHSGLAGTHSLRHLCGKFNKVITIKVTIT